MSKDPINFDFDTNYEFLDGKLIENSVESETMIIIISIQDHVTPLTMDHGQYASLSRTAVLLLLSAWSQGVIICAYKHT